MSPSGSVNPTSESRHTTSAPSPRSCTAGARGTIAPIPSPSASAAAERDAGPVEFDVTFESRAATPSPSELTWRSKDVWIKCSGVNSEILTIDLGSGNGSWRIAEQSFLQETRPWLTPARFLTHSLRTTCDRIQGESRAVAEARRDPERARPGGQRSLLGSPAGNSPPFRPPRHPSRVLQSGPVRAEPMIPPGPCRIRRGPTFRRISRTSISRTSHGGVSSRRSWRTSAALPVSSTRSGYGNSPARRAVRSNWRSGNPARTDRVRSATSSTSDTV